MFHDVRPPLCFRAFRRAPSGSRPGALASAAMEADRLAGYAENHLRGLPAHLPALRTKVEGLADRVWAAMPPSHGQLAAVEAAVQACCTAAQNAWISGVASASSASAKDVAAGLQALADALGNLHAVLEEASVSVEEAR